MKITKNGCHFPQKAKDLSKISPKNKKSNLRFKKNMKTEKFEKNRHSGALYFSIIGLIMIFSYNMYLDKLSEEFKKGFAAGKISTSIQIKNGK